MNLLIAYILVGRKCIEGFNDAICVADCSFMLACVMSSYGEIMEELPALP